MYRGGGDDCIDLVKIPDEPEITSSRLNISKKCYPKVSALVSGNVALIGKRNVIDHPSSLREIPQYNKIKNAIRELESKGDSSGLYGYEMNSSCILSKHALLEMLKIPLEEKISKEIVQEDRWLSKILNMNISLPIMTNNTILIDIPSIFISLIQDNSELFEVPNTCLRIDTLKDLVDVRLVAF